MKGLHYIGLDVHKKSISYVIKAYAGELVERSQGAAHQPRPGRPSFARGLTSGKGWLSLLRRLPPAGGERRAAPAGKLTHRGCSHEKNDDE